MSGLLNLPAFNRIFQRTDLNIQNLILARNVVARQVYRVLRNEIFCILSGIENLYTNRGNLVVKYAPLNLDAK